ncbi:excisionase family DNA binding protein [Amycolatopsis bartoniae]|uniref:MerR family transcriptional regulator n=1 Tax=Amycolatopsis bartoniae TaxID=941986 RepID=A0A8H9J123_9PSEU|nr:helix-turn-helix domain-containing protein [Amycolatopsis bartoniae]MBB2935488.1 excisionase family DNA binding protein [Amycolatopsis bartoniae]TVT04498.1 helix-turn-helix domain-containing protein [Amycolatopsis bartoniae]GHF76332.1 MerR family transcriptional regulator [Amycolatopsis bartoniae]
MTGKLYSAEEVAERLGLHVRTVRGYVRDGRLKAVRIGKQYRITQEDLEALLGTPVTEEPEVRRERHVEVSAIVEVDAVGPEKVGRVTTLLMAASARQGDRPLRVQTAYDEQRGRLKVVVFGGLTDTARLLEYVEAVLES